MELGWMKFCTVLLEPFLFFNALWRLYGIVHCSVLIRLRHTSHCTLLSLLYLVLRWLLISPIWWHILECSEPWLRLECQHMYLSNQYFPATSSFSSYRTLGILLRTVYALSHCDVPPSCTPHRSEQFSLPLDPALRYLIRYQEF